MLTLPLVVVHDTSLPTYWFWPPTTTLAFGVAAAADVGLGDVDDGGACVAGGAGIGAMIVVAAGGGGGEAVCRRLDS
jgi:hypothetical protein